MSLEIRNPAKPAEVVATYEQTPATALDGIVARAQAAQKHWAGVTQIERGQIICAFLGALENEADDIARSMTREMGKTLGESKAEIAKALGEGRLTADRAGAPVGDILPSQVPGTTAFTLRRPRGVILGINPWNFPFSTPIRKTVPALLYGNAIVLKPASLSPGAVLKICDIASNHFPDGLVQAVVGPGALAQSLCEHSGVNAVSFTGSVDVGRRVAMAAVSHFAEVSLELGGKNPVVLNDADDLETVLDQIIAAAFAVCGQRCTAISRVIVHEDLHDRAVAGLARRAAAITPTDGSAEGARMGPLSSAEQLADVSGFVERAVVEGARIASGGQPIETPQGGYFYAPTILADVTHHMEIAREEVFGPVLALIPYRDLDEALSIANDVAYGLASCLYSQQLPVVERFISESESGMIHINAGSFPENHLPFVGVKDSALGVGGSNGASTIQFYTTEHTVYRRAQ